MSNEETYVQDDLVKYECDTCQRQFIVGKKAVKSIIKEKYEHLRCPYCGEWLVDWISEFSVRDMLLEGIDLGCMSFFTEIKSKENTGHEE